MSHAKAIWEGGKQSNGRAERVKLKVKEGVA